MRSRSVDRDPRVPSVQAASDEGDRAGEGVASAMKLSYVLGEWYSARRNVGIALVFSPTALAVGVIWRRDDMPLELHICPLPMFRVSINLFASEDSR